MTTDSTVGLTSAAARDLVALYGPNALPEARSVPLTLRFVRQFQNPLIYILLFALTFDLGAWLYKGHSGWPVEALVIAAVLLLNSGLGTFQEYRSEQALARLRTLATPLAWVLRDGKLVRLPSRELVPGDVVRVESGDRVSADGILIEAHGVMLDESVLTGESLPVDKAEAAEIFSGTLLVRGKGAMRVRKTGTSSTMGKLASMLGAIELEKTPLEKRLTRLGHQVARWVGGIAIMLAVAGLIVEGGGRFDETLLFAVALAVAAVPEGMPAVVTLTLALGVQRMAKRHALVRRLSAVEALGSVTVIATDKTGTLTENRMAVQYLDASNKDAALLAMVIASDADLASGAGDPLEVALLEHARREGLDLATARDTRPRQSVRSFDSATKFMRVTVDEPTGVVSYFKGAPEVLLERCCLSSGERERWAQRAEAHAANGYRVLALARGAGAHEQELEFLALVTLWDPPREEVPQAIRSAERAGVRVVMITGDHPATAAAVAERIGLSPVNVLTGGSIDELDSEALRDAVRGATVFARVTPEHKLRLVEALKADGEIVAMTGDGVNDAPALKRADVGIAMGQRGSDVTREVADIVLLDDNFASIVGAMEEGRGIYENIQTFVRYTFSTNVALLFLVAAGAIGSYVEGLRNANGALLLPLTALQLLWVNFLGDGPPALALALDRSPGVMSRPPRPVNSELLDGASKRFILASGAFKGVVGILLLLALPLVGASLIATQTAIFLFESIGKLVSAYPARRLLHAHQRNLVLHASVLLGVGLQILTLVVPMLRDVLDLELLTPVTCGIVVGSILCTWLFGQAASAWAGRARGVRSEGVRLAPRVRTPPSIIPNNGNG